MSDFIVKASTANQFIPVGQTEEQMLVMQLARTALKIYRQHTILPVENVFLCGAPGMMLVDEAKIWFTDIVPDPDIKPQEYEITFGAFGNYFGHRPLITRLISVTYKGVWLKVLLSVSFKAFPDPGSSAYEGDYIYVHDEVPFLTPSLLKDFYSKERPVKPLIVRAAENWVKEVQTHGRPVSELERDAISKHRARVNELDRSIKTIAAALQMDEFGIPPLPDLPATNNGERMKDLENLKQVKHGLMSLAHPDPARTIFKQLTGLTPELLASQINEDFIGHPPQFIRHLHEIAETHKVNIIVPSAPKPDPQPETLAQLSDKLSGLHHAQVSLINSLFLISAKLDATKLPDGLVTNLQCAEINLRIARNKMRETTPESGKNNFTMTNPFKPENNPTKD